MRDGIPLRYVVIGAAAILAALAAATALSFRAIEADLTSERSIEVEEVAPGPADFARAGSEVVLDEAAANRAIFAEWLTDPGRDARLRFEAPYARLRLAQRDPATGRWLNADLVVEPYAGERGLAFKVLSGTVGRVSISRTSGEWVRGKIERQLAHAMAENPRTAKLFGGLVDARVRVEGLALSFGR